jgi:hypothetical protein
MLLITVNHSLQAGPVVAFSSFNLSWQQNENNYGPKTVF